MNEWFKISSVTETWMQSVCNSGPQDRLSVLPGAEPLVSDVLLLSREILLPEIGLRP